MRGGRSLRLLVTACMHTRVAPLLMPATAPKWKGALRKSFQANGGLLYKTNFLSPETYEEVRNECRSLRRHFKRELDSIATGRMGCCLDSRSQAYLNLMTDDISTALSGVTGLTLFPSDFPVECRLYTPKASMDWHQDDELYAEPQALTATLSTIHCAHTPHIPHAHTHRTRHTARTLLHMHCTPHTAHGTRHTARALHAQTEVVFTLDNDSDSRTEWVDPTGERHSVQTEPNSAIIVRAGQLGPPHRVTPSRRGERWILKLVYTSTNERSPDYATHIDSFPKAKKAGKAKRR